MAEPALVWSIYVGIFFNICNRIHDSACRYMELYSKPKKCSLYDNGFYMDGCYCNGTIFFAEVLSLSLKRK